MDNKRRIKVKVRSYAYLWENKDRGYGIKGSMYSLYGFHLVIG